MNKIMVLSLGCLFFGLGLEISDYSLFEVYKALSSKGWPTANGVIVSSQVNPSMINSGQDAGVLYHASIVYKYNVNGTVYEGKKIKFGELEGTAPDASRMLLNQYRNNEAISVYYRPGSPGEAVLEPGLHRNTWFIPLFGLFVVGMSVLLAMVSFSQDKSFPQKSRATAPAHRIPGVRFFRAQQSHPG
ncbi:MAG: DUF3592 domain-containing protein [Candidatus Electrothrix sp. YB6]